MRPPDAEIRNFIQKIRIAIQHQNFDILAHRRKYMDTIAALGIIEEDVIDDISHLNEHDYWFKTQDNNPIYPGDVWICKKFLHNSNIYIKLKIKIDENGKLLIISYHFDGMQ